MNKIIVPIDFSDTSENAALFAANFSKQIPDAHIVLYHVFDKINAGSDGTPLESDDTDRKAIIEFALQKIQQTLSPLTNASFSVFTEEDNHFVESLDRYARHENAQMIIMGITGASKLGEILMGSNTLNLINRETVPVLIVPPDAKYKNSKNVMLISDFKEVDKTIPVAALRQVLGMLQPTLYVVNVDADHYIELSDAYKAERAKMEKILAGFNPEYAFIRMYDFIDSINQFADDKNIDIIITFPKSHSFLSNIFKTSHTKKLVYHSHVPIVAIHS